MELIGKVVSYDRQPKDCYFLFRCTNKEEMTIEHPSGFSELPENVLLRIFTARRQLTDGRLSRQHVLVQWTRLDDDEEKVYVIGRGKRQKVIKWIKEDF